MRAVIRDGGGTNIATFEDSAVALLSLPAVTRAVRKPPTLVEYGPREGNFAKPTQVIPLPRGCYWEGNLIHCRP